MTAARLHDDDSPTKPIKFRNAAYVANLKSETRASVDALDHDVKAAKNEAERMEAIILWLREQNMKSCSRIADRTEQLLQEERAVTWARVAALEAKVVRLESALASIKRT